MLKQVRGRVGRQWQMGRVAVVFRACHAKFCGGAGSWIGKRFLYCLEIDEDLSGINHFDLFESNVSDKSHSFRGRSLSRESMYSVSSLAIFPSRYIPPDCSLSLSSSVA